LPQIVKNRVKPIAEKLRENVDLINFLEDKDVQYLAIKKVLSSLRDLRKTSFIVVGVASVSYMLSLKGEEHWLSLSDYVESRKKHNPEEVLRGFVKESGSLARFRSARLKRIDLLVRARPDFENKFDSFIGDLNELRRFLAHTLGAGLEDKTIVFSVKMFYYTLKAAGLYVSVPTDIPVPVDRRVALVSLTSGLLEYPALHYLKAANELRGRYSKLVREAWSKVCRLAGVPPLRVDSLLWIVGGFLEKSGFNYLRALQLIEDWLSSRLNSRWRGLIKELSYKLVETRRIHSL